MRSKFRIGLMILITIIVSSCSNSSSKESISHLKELSNGIEIVPPKPEYIGITYDHLLKKNDDVYFLLTFKNNTPFTIEGIIFSFSIYDPNGMLVLEGYSLADFGNSSMASFKEELKSNSSVRRCLFELVLIKGGDGNTNIRYLNEIFGQVPLKLLREYKIKIDDFKVYKASYLDIKYESKYSITKHGIFLK